MPSIYEIAQAAGRSGWASSGAAQASAGALDMAQRVRNWAASLAEQVSREAVHVHTATGTARVAGQVQWTSAAGRAFQKGLEVECLAGQRLWGELDQTAHHIRISGEMVALELEAAATAVKAAGAALDLALSGMGVIEDVLDDFVVYAQKAGVPGLHAELVQAMNNPLLAQVSTALAGVGR